MGESINKLIGAGVLDPTEAPFEESENEAPKEEEEEEKYTLPHTIELKYPIKKGSETIESVTFNRVPSAGDCMHLPMVGEYKMGHFVPIISACTGDSTVVIKRMSAPDFRQCLAVVTHFLFVAGSSDEE